MRNCLRAQPLTRNSDEVASFIWVCVCVCKGSTSRILFNCALAFCSATLRTLIFVFMFLVVIKRRVSRPASTRSTNFGQKRNIGRTPNNILRVIKWFGRKLREFSLIDILREPSFEARYGGVGAKGGHASPPGTWKPYQNSIISWSSRPRFVVKNFKKCVCPPQKISLWAPMHRPALNRSAALVQEVIRLPLYDTGYSRDTNLLWYLWINDWGREHKMSTIRQDWAKVSKLLVKRKQ